ncbi:MAG: NifB/NifX family molybdenum-iron cluster-binding protein [Thermodesulfobacteriota bacterium]|nr:NifB/NifX family molybdenum-iron cluster-binding protein [Thermodesulfobacteriota bacterium]
MKICVTASGEGLDAKIDPRFGRCQYFTIIDLDTMEFESLQNSSIGASGGAGIQAAQFVANKGVDLVLTGNVGPNAYNTLEAADICVITGVAGEVRQAVDDYKSGKLQQPIPGPSVGAHSGMSSTMRAGRAGERGMASLGVSSSDNASSHVRSWNEELDALKEQTQTMKTQLNEIIQRLDNLKGEDPTSENQSAGISQVKEALKKRRTS